MSGTGSHGDSGAFFHPLGIPNPAQTSQNSSIDEVPLRAHPAHSPLSSRNSAIRAFVTADGSLQRGDELRRPRRRRLTRVKCASRLGCGPFCSAPVPLSSRGREVYRLPVEISTSIRLHAAFLPALLREPCSTVPDRGLRTDGPAPKMAHPVALPTSSDHACGRPASGKAA
jgi:hypothetical protein